MSAEAVRPARRGRRSLIAAAALGAAGLACLGLVASQASHHTEPPVSSTSSQSTTQAPAAAPSATRRAALVMQASRPATLSIPAIGVRSRVQSLGQNADSSIEVPAVGPHYDEAGWYRYSPTPGELGPSIVVGHVDSAKSGPSVFYRLGELRAKDRVSISRADGSVAIFAVTAVRRYPKNAFPTQLVYGNTTDSELRLLTCGGPFDKKTGHFEDNIVVFARLVRADPSASTS
jgi:sortase (surface protein transpeptidase)